MIKIRDMEVGKSYSTVLVVISATARETRAKKPYLQMEFFDGTDSISGNYWNWSGKNVPEKNAILNVNAQLTEMAFSTSTSESSIFVSVTLYGCRAEMVSQFLLSFL